MNANSFGARTALTVGDLNYGIYHRGPPAHRALTPGAMPTRPDE